MKGSIKWAAMVGVVCSFSFGASVSCSSGKHSADANSAGGNQSLDLDGSAATGNSTQTSCEPGPDDQGCVGQAFEGESIPLDIFVMFDLSCSMSCSVDHSGCCRQSSTPDPLDQWRIQPVRAAMTSFLQDPDSAGIGVGLGFFGDHALDQNMDPTVCSVANYTDAAVEIAPLPGSANALITALDAGEPQGGTPTQLAIAGACEHVDVWKQAHPSHKVVILLVTDGIPEYSCNATIQLATDAATQCYNGGQGFQTYVLGVVANNNNSLDQLNQIAVAGGTTQAYLTDTTNVEASVLAALNAIRADAVIPCELEIPAPTAGQTLDYAKVNVGICDAAGAVQVTPYVQTAAGCTGPGWHYDDPTNPATIQLCDATCNTVSVPGAKLFFSVGCATQTSIH